jgi:hypothetical protein
MCHVCPSFLCPPIVHVYYVYETLRFLTIQLRFDYHNIHLWVTLHIYENPYAPKVV